MKKTLTIGTAAAMLLATSLFSCKKENHSPANSLTKQTVDVINNNGILQFKDSQALSNTISSLVNKDINYLDNWQKGLSFSSLRSDTAASSKFENFGFPDFYETILNNKGEYMIGDTIVFFSNGYKYLVPNKNEDMVARIKKDPSTTALKFQAGSSNINTVTNSSSSLKSPGLNLASLDNNYVDARYQYQFHKDGDPNSQRKIVFEIQNYYEQNGSGAYVCYMHTRIKQEYLAGNQAGNWKPAGEVMEKSISNLSYDVAFINTGNGTTTHVKNSGISTGTHTDASNLDYVMVTFQASQSAVTASVSGDYHAKVIPAGNSAGHYDVNPATW